MIREISLVFIVVIVLIFLFYKSKKDNLVGKRVILGKENIPKRKTVSNNGYDRDDPVKSISSRKTGEVLEINQTVSSRVISHENRTAPVTIDQVKHIVENEIRDIDASIDALEKQISKNSGHADSAEIITKVAEAKLDQYKPDIRFYGGTSFD